MGSEFCSGVRADVVDRREDVGVVRGGEAVGDGGRSADGR